MTDLADGCDSDDVTKSPKISLIFDVEFFACDIGEEWNEGDRGYAGLPVDEVKEVLELFKSKFLNA